MRFNLEFVLGIAFIVFMTTIALVTVGEMPKQPPHPTPWWVPLMMLGVTGIPFLCGFLAGRDR